MARVTKTAVTVTTDASGDGSAEAGPFSGHLVKVVYVKDDYADGIDVDITGAVGASVLLSADNVNASATFYPVVLSSLNTSGANIASVYSRIPLADELVTVTVAAGGNAKTGTWYLYVEGTP